jgi:hypothetical protein
MLLCKQPSTELWSPDFSTSGGRSPDWTRAKCGDVELCNSLEWVEWDANPVQVQLCDACGTAGCASGGYVHMSIQTDLILWTAPQMNAESSFDRISSATAIERFGAVAFLPEAWRQFGTVATNIPETHQIPPANGQAIRDAWIMGPHRPKGEDKLRDWLQRRLLAADSLETTDAIKSVEHWLSWFDARATIAVEGYIATTEDSGALIEKLYFDGPGSEDWPALARLDNCIVPALSPTHIFVPVSG